MSVEQRQDLIATILTDVKFPSLRSDQQAPVSIVINNSTIADINRVDSADIAPEDNR